MAALVTRVDDFQRRHPVVGFPLGVLYKFFDDQGNYLAAILTYYAFVAIFPLMLLGTSILGFVLGAKPEWQEEILDSALAQFPIVGDQLGRPEGLRGSAAGVAFGALAALYGALGLAQSLQNAMHVAWSVPRNSRPNPFYARLKSLILLLTAGSMLKPEDEDSSSAENFVIRLARKVFHTTEHYDGDRLFTVENGKRVMTPMLLVMAAIGGTDILFALD